MAGLYVVVSWLVVQVIGALAPMFGAPEWVGRTVVLLLAVLFVPALIFAWVYEITPEGLKRESEIDRHASITPDTGRRMDRAILAGLALALVVFAVDRFVLSPRRAAAPVAQAAPTATAPVAAVAIGDKSIAVLPFVNMSSDQEQEFFSDGISEELLNLLARVETLQVAARTSSFAFKGKDVPIPEIAKALNVAHVLEGSVRKSGDQVRITAQLIRAADGYHVWSETWDRKLDDIFKIQDEIAGKVVEQLKEKLLGETPKARATDPRAYALFLQAAQYGRVLQADAYAKSDELYRQVLAIDPRYAPAWEGLSANLTGKATLGVIPSPEAYAQAREAAEKAVAIDPGFALAHARLGYIVDGQGDLAGAARHVSEALRLAPGDPEVLRLAAVFAMDLGRIDEGVALYEAASRRDPLNPAVLSSLGFAQRMAGRFDAAAATMRNLKILTPGRSSTSYMQGVLLMLKGDPAAALPEFEQETSEAWRAIGVPMAYHALGRKDASDRALAALVAKYEQDAPYNIAYVHAFRGDADQAFAWLDKAVQYRDPGISEIATENLFANVHEDPRWLPFLRKVGRAPEQLERIEFTVNIPGAPAPAAKPAT